MGELQIIPLLSLGRRDVSDGLQESVVIEPGHPFEGGEFQGLHGFPRCPAMDQFGLVQAVDGFGEGVVVAIALAADGRLDAGFRQALGVADGDVLRTPVGMMDQGSVTFRLAGVERLLQGIEHEVGPHRPADPPPDNATGKDVDDEGNIDESLPSRDVGEIRDPQLVWPIRLELPIDPVQRARRGGIAEGRANDLPTHDAAQAETPHQSFDGATHHLNAFPLQLPPDLVGAIDLEIGLPDPLDMGNQEFVPSGPGTAQRRIPLPGGMAPVGGRGDPQ